MYFLKILFSNFLVVFFADYILPGIIVTDQTKLPHIGTDLIFAVILGLLNSLIFPVLKLIKQEANGLRIALIGLVMNFLVYAIIKIAPTGINIISVEGYISVSLIVTLGGFLTNFLEMRHSQTETVHKTDLPQ